MPFAIWCLIAGVVAFDGFVRALDLVGLVLMWECPSPGFSGCFVSGWCAAL